MPGPDKPPPLNAIRVFVAIAREMSVTRAAAALEITQSAASRHLAVLEAYLGARLLSRRGRYIELTEFGRLYFEATADALDSISFVSRRMRQRREAVNRLVVRTSLPTFAYSTLIPNLPKFTAAHDGASVDIVTSLAAPKGNDQFDVLVTRDLAMREAADQWELVEEHLICVGAPSVVGNVPLKELVRRAPIFGVTSRPDILPRWTTALGIPLAKIVQGPRYDHHFLAIPAAATGQGMLVAPEIVVADLVQQGVLVAVASSRVKSGMHYRAYSVDRTDSFELARAFCQWVTKLCREQTAALE
jgi:LysR family transcriptional regulator, glycine cleavage system transcriptional activator